MVGRKPWQTEYRRYIEHNLKHISFFSHHQLNATAGSGHRSGKPFPYLYLQSVRQAAGRAVPRAAAATAGIAGLLWLRRRLFRSTALHTADVLRRPRQRRIAPHGKLEHTNLYGRAQFQVCSSLERNDLHKRLTKVYQSGHAPVLASRNERARRPVPCACVHGRGAEACARPRERHPARARAPQTSSPPAPPVAPRRCMTEQAAEATQGFSYTKSIL